jgi:S-adenosylmethionine:tRNA ribosyltransferase-isomerase
VVAVGTTVVRTLETAAGASGSVSPGEGWSELFIVPGHRFSVVDAMLTNFHAPRTTLVALLAAAIGPAWRDVYRTAVERRYRFLSFGDAMLVDPVGAMR